MFSELHVHSEYSMRDGANSVNKLIDRAIELEHKAIAITDHGTLAGIIPAYMYAKEKGIKLIVGCEFYVGREERHHLVVLAKNEKGYKNLLRLNAIANDPEHFYYKPTIEEADLFSHSEGLIVMTACIGGKHGQLIINGKRNECEDSLCMYKNAFKDDFYIEIQHNTIPVQESVNRELISLSRILNIKLIATNDAHYLTKEDAYAHEVLLAIQQQKKMSEERWKFDGASYYLHSYVEMTTTPLPMEAILNTQEIVNKCNVEIDLNSIHAPSFKGLKKEEEVALLKTKLNQWYSKSFGNTYNKEVIERMNRELKVIIDKDFVGYFLLVADYINAFEHMTVEQYGIVQNLMCGAGRGSGVGSLVAYALGITKVNPLEYDLLFERFINVDRLSYPDIDTDFDYEHREKGIEYMLDTYGAEHVAQISAFGTLQPKATFRAILSSFEYPKNIINKVSKLIPENCESIEDALKKNPALVFATKGMDKEIEVMKRLEGIVTTQSTHPAGVVVTDNPIYTYAPVHTDSKNRNKYVLSLDKKKTEKAGLIKHDFLGLKTLTIIRKALARIKRTYGEDIDVWNLEKDDRGVYHLLNSGALQGVFQLDGDYAKQVVEKVKPQCFDDIIACEAICRPGVKEASDYIEKHGNFTGHEEVDSIIRATHGAIIFQEQTMLLMNTIAGWTLGKADYMRKVKDLEEYREDFVSSATKRGYDVNFANSIYDRFDLGYSFNKSHAVAYAFITYATAYLKAYYPLEYMCEFIDMYKDEQETVSKAIGECKVLNINILPPNVNAIHVGFDVVEGGIAFGLSGVNGVGEKAVEKLLEYTNKTKIHTLQELIDSKTLNKTGIIAMVKCGVFDNEGTRQELINRYIATRSKKERESEMITEYNDKIKLRWEKEVCGIYLSSHPLDKYVVKNFSDLSLTGVFGGIINSVRVIKTQKGDDMAFLLVEDREQIIDVVVFPKVYAKCKHDLAEGRIIFSRGKKEGNAKWVADNIERIGSV